MSGEWKRLGGEGRDFLTFIVLSNQVKECGCSPSFARLQNVSGEVSISLRFAIF